jgi:transporter family protein
MRRSRRPPTRRPERVIGPDWRLYALGSAVFAALTALFGKLGVERMSSDLATFYRSVIVVLLLAVVLWARHEWQRPDDAFSARSLVFLTLSGCATGLSWLCYYRALQLGPASRVAPIDKLSVVFAVLLAALILGERLTFRACLGAALITGGAVLMAL